jgi:hypothetical protein
MTVKLYKTKNLCLFENGRFYKGYVEAVQKNFTPILGIKREYNTWK